jgi:hypothetical protein
MSTKLVEEFNFSQLKDFAKNKEIPRRTTMKTPIELAEFLVRHGYTNNDVKQYLESKNITPKKIKKQPVSQKSEGPVKTIDDRVLNPQTGRLIKVGTKKYNDLVASGVIKGQITSPAKGKKESAEKKPASPAKKPKTPAKGKKESAEKKPASPAKKKPKTPAKSKKESAEKKPTSPAKKKPISPAKKPQTLAKGKKESTSPKKKEPAKKKSTAPAKVRNPPARSSLEKQVVSPARPRKLPYKDNKTPNCEKGKILNKSTGRCIKDTPANRKKAGIKSDV